MKVLQPQVQKSNGSILVSLPSRPKICLAIDMRWLFSESSVLPYGMESSLNAFRRLRVTNLWSSMSWEFAALKLDNYISHGLECAIEVRWSYFMPEIIFSNSSHHGTGTPLCQTCAMMRAFFDVAAMSVSAIGRQSK